tara:strand:- start:532 stop:744 length:213 start_codon:yes stop_codon:yes gene_type:complete
MESNVRKNCRLGEQMNEHKIMLAIPFELWNKLEKKRIKIQEKKGKTYNKKEYLTDILKGEVENGKQETNS